MKKILSCVALASTLAVPALSLAEEVTFTTTLKNYGGKEAFLAMYLTDAAGDYEQTLWVSGRKTKYYRALVGWAQASGLDSGEYDGRSGASIAAGGSYTVTLDVDDALIDSGYQIRIDSAVEHEGVGRDDVVVDFTRQGASASVSGSNFVQAFRYDL